MATLFPSFSVLMSVYSKDNPVWVAQAMTSVLENTVSPSEVVLVVDGPVPQEVQAVLAQYSTRYSQIKLLPLEQNQGLGIALQKGLLACTHELVARMDSDDLCQNDRFEKQLSRFMQEPNLALLGGAVEEVDADSLQTVSFRRLPCEDAAIKQFLKTRCPFNHDTVMFKKTAILKAGNYQPFHFLEDYYLWIRCVAAGYTMANLADCLARMRVGKAMYKRRGGWTYFKNNKALYAKMHQMGLITGCNYGYILLVRFVVQVLMPNKLRGLFYKGVLR